MKIVLELKRPDFVSLTKVAQGQGQAQLVGLRLTDLAHRILEQNGQRHCVVCGCTDNKACAGGCSWVMIHQRTPTGVCSKCWIKFLTQIDSIEAS